MSDDLISRKALLKELREIMDEPHNTMFLMGIGAAVSIVEHRETAFDKEKVIEELEEIGQECNECNDIFGAEAIEYTGRLWYDERKNVDIDTTYEISEKRLLEEILDKNPEKSERGH